MDFESLQIPDIVLIMPKKHGDPRGFFSKTFRGDAVIDMRPNPIVADWWRPLRDRRASRTCESVRCGSTLWEPRARASEVLALAGCRPRQRGRWVRLKCGAVRTLAAVRNDHVYLMGAV
jgi:hypothetical protein